MTVSVRMLKDIASGVQELADSLKKLSDDCAQQLAENRAEKNVDVPPCRLNEQPQQPHTSEPEGNIPSTQERASALTLVELRSRVAACSTPENRPKIKAIPESHGVKKLTELPDNKYWVVLTEVEQACGQ